MVIDPRLAERRQAVAEERAKRNVRRLLKYLIALILVSAVAWVAMSPWMSISQVRSTGIVSSDAHEIMVEQGLVAGTPLILVRSGQVEEALEEDPWISDARVHLNWPDEAVVRVIERTPVAWVRTSDGWTRRALDGVALPSPPGPRAGMAWVELPGILSDQAVSSQWVLGAVEFADALGQDYGDAVVRLQGEELWASIGGYEARLGRPVDMAAKARSLLALLEEEPPPGSVLVLIAPGHPAVKPPDGLPVGVGPNPGEPESQP